MYVVTILERPKAKERPRITVRGFRRSGGKERNARWNPDKPPGPVGAHVYTPKATLEYEQLVAAEALAQGVRKIEGPVGIEAEFYVLRGRSEPDADNLLKALFDGLKGVAYDDDRQIIYIDAKKVYVASRSEQKTVARIGKADEFERAPA
ncbi:MAG TPA: RusA family crossover junction endodeoxyribonuclease, partial [Firmicutes bacterium]|nr:RusA family crossover junction endodeoxyribonuclease [Candidatus Fermentithermobacillaceae bacterium]